MPTHPSCASTHQENRVKVCGPCGKKIILGQKCYTNFQLTETHQQLIEKHMKRNYNLKDERFPLSICATCRLVLLQHEDDDFKRPLPTLPNYEKILLPKTTRINNVSTNVCLTCNCYIWLTGKSKAHPSNKTGGKNDVSTAKITASNGLYGSQNLKITSLPKVKTSIQSNTMIICKICKTEVHKGKSHVCSKRDYVARKNVAKLVDELPNKQQEYIASKIINEKAKSNSTNSITLNTEGRRKRIFLKEKNTEVTFSSKDLDNYHTNTGCSIRHMNNLTTFIAGRKSVPSHYSQHVSGRTKLLKDIYNVDMLEFDIKNSNKKEIRPVVWADAEKLLEAVLKKRNIIGDYIVKVMADGGQGFFKICLSTIPLTPTETDLENDVPKKQRRIDSTNSMKTSNPDSSVKKLIMLCTRQEEVN